MHKSSSTTKQPCNQAVPILAKCPTGSFGLNSPSFFYSTANKLLPTPFPFFITSLFLSHDCLSFYNKNPIAPPLAFVLHSMPHRATRSTPTRSTLVGLPCALHFHQVFNTLLQCPFTWPVWCSLSIQALFLFAALSSFPSAWNDISFPRSIRRLVLVSRRSGILFGMCDIFLRSL